MEEALVGAFSVIVKTNCETDGSFSTVFCPTLGKKLAHCLSCPGSNVNTSVISSPELKPSVLCQESRAQLGFIIVPNLVLVIKEAILTRQNTIYPDQTRRTFIFNSCSYFLCVSRFILFDTVPLKKYFYYI